MSEEAKEWERTPCSKAKYPVATESKPTLRSTLVLSAMAPPTPEVVPVLPNFILPNPIAALLRGIIGFRLF